MVRAIFCLLIGALIGGLIVSFFSAAPNTSLAPSDAAPASVAVIQTAPSAERVEAPAYPTHEAQRMAERVLDTELITTALRAYAEAGMRKGWIDSRHDEMPAEDLAEGLKQYETLVLEKPLDIGRSLAERRTKALQALEDAKSGGAFSLLRSLSASGVGPLPGLVRDESQFSSLFQRMVADASRDGLANREHPDKEIEDGVTLTWPPGVYRVRQLMRDANPFPRDVTLAGAGMNSTMLVLDSTLATRGELRNFTIRDCTVHTSGYYLFDLRTNPASIHLERARFVGFDSGAGSSCLFGTVGLALWAKNCRFEGGYGRSPTHGSLFDVQTQALLARFESCTLSLMNLRAAYFAPGASVLFVGCSLEEMIDDPLGDAADHFGTLFDGCTISTRAGGSQDVPHLAGASFNVLKQWADALSLRITYLLENIGPLEFDPTTQQVLIRSKTPDLRTGGAKYYEVLLQCQSAGHFMLRRFHSDPAQCGRDQVDLAMTHETLLKLVEDLLATVP